MTSAALRHWIGALEIGDGWAAWRGRSGDAELHRHVAAQAVFAVDGLVALEDGVGVEHCGACVLVEPMAKHRLRASVEIELVFVEPWTAWSRVPALFRSREVPNAVDVPIVLDHPASPARDSFWTTIRGGVNTSGAKPSDWSIEACAFVERSLEGGRVSLAGLAAFTGLSPDRARHRFADEVGLPLKRYVLWRRLRLAALRLQSGADATRAAHDAGFADSAHLARTLKSMFGVTVTQTLVNRS